MLPKITRLQVSNFRGIRELQINVHKGECLLVIGDNGTGKSSIIDAIEFFFTKEINKFSGRGDITPRDCIPFTGADPLTCYVDFEFENIPIPTRAQFIPSDTMKGSAVWGNIPEKLKPLIDTASKRSFILHRAQLTQFIESKPAQRFTSISELIGIDFLDKTVDAWKKERTDRDRKKSEAEKIYEEKSREFSALLDQSIKAEDDIRNAIYARIAPYGIGPINNPEEIEEKKTQLTSKSSNSQNQIDASKYQGYKDKVNQIISDWNSFLEKYDLLFTAWQSFLVKASCISEADFEIVIKEGRRLISEKQLDTCPICEQSIDRESVIGRLDQREQELLALVESRNLVEAKRRDALRELQKCISPMQSLIHMSKGLNITVPERLVESWDVLEAIELSLNQSPIVLEPTECWQNHEVINFVLTELLVSQGQAANEIIALTPSEYDRKISDTIFFLGKVSEKWVGWRKALQELKRTRKVFGLVDQIYSKLIEARKKGIGEIVDNLEKDFLRLYEKLHPGEGHKAIQIILPENRDASADLRTETEGMKPMHPLGNYSEGHLDSLGLCIFLAFIKHFNKDVPLIVLDDVLTSIDAGHRMKVAQLIASEFKGNQLIITTHDEMWANELVAVIRKEQVPVKVIRMNPWNKENGATYDEYVDSNWDYYKEQIAQGRKQDAIGGAGRNLEQFLSTMRRHLHLAVPATIDDRYTLGPLLPVFWKWVKDHLIERSDFADFPQQLEMLNEEFDVYWHLRNWSGAHYNEWGAKVSPEEAITFVSIVEELVKCFQCPACSSLVIYDSAQKLLRCPVCNPTPPPKIKWEYNPNWKNNAQRLLVNMQHKSRFRKDFLQLSQTTYEKVLKDSRRRFQLIVPSTIDDNYAVADLMPLFFDHLCKYPCSEDMEWFEGLDNKKKRLCEFFNSEFQWHPIESLISRAEELYQVISGLTEMVTCSSCHELLKFSSSTNTYSCMKCSSNELQVFPAAWFVQDKKA